MPAAMVLEFPGMTRELYEQIGANLGQVGPPAGLLYHACGPVAGGWRIMDIWESPEAFDQFVDERYLPTVRTHGGPTPSRREVVPTHHAGPVQRE